MSARRRRIRQSLIAAAAVTALSPSFAAAMPAGDLAAPSVSPDQGRSDASYRTSYQPTAPAVGRSDASWRTADEPSTPASDLGRSDASWRTADEPAAPTSVVRTISDDGSDLVPVLPVGIVLLVVAGGAGFTVVRMHGRRPGLSH